MRTEPLDQAPVTESVAARLPHIDVMDGLRGLAMAMVVLFHYWQLSFWIFPNVGGASLETIQFAGFLGVELFFFISGFCLFFPYANGRVPSLRHFYYRRAIKIVPSYLLAVVVFGFVFTDLYPSTWSHGKLADVGLHLVFLQNLNPATHGSIDGVMWSLAVEVQFYLLFPAIAWLFRRQPFPTAAAMLAISVAFRAWDRGRSTDGNLGLAADMLPAYLDLFAFGMLAATVMVWVRKRHETAQRIRIPLTAVAAVTVVLLLQLFSWVYTIRTQTPAGVWQSENRPYLGALFLVLAVASAFALPLWRTILSNRVLVFLSTISYNLYLWHQAIGLLIRNRNWWPADTPVPTDDPHWRWTYTLIAVTLSVIVATLITYLFERPLLRDGVRGTVARVTRRVGRRPEAPRGVEPAPISD